MLLLLASVLMTAPAAASAQERSPTPSAEDLWRAYPLREGQEPTPTPAESRPASAPVRAGDEGDGDGTPVVWPAALLAALLGVAGVVVLRRRGGRRRSLSPPALAGPLLPAALATAMVPPRNHRPRRLTDLAMDTTGRDNGREDMRPSDPDRSWTAEVEWHQEGGRARFTVVARSGEDDAGVLVGSSAPLAWPPPDGRAVQRLSEAADRLEAALIGAGWTPLPPGSAWYAKRFAWSPATQPVTALPQATPEPGGRRFERQVDVEWPPENLWRCEIRWHAGYMNSRFEALAHAPARRRGMTVCSGTVFRWQLMADPDHKSPEQVEEVRRIAERLTAAGWERAGKGRHWWEIRFVWRRDGAPPEHLELEPVETSATTEGEDDAGR